MICAGFMISVLGHSIKAAINDQTYKTPQLSGYLVHSVRLKQLLMEQKITFIVNTMGSRSHKYL